MSNRRQLPIGIHTFEQIRQDNLIYVDKTKMIKSLWDDGRVYFLSRPRRFGKSLLLDTIHQLVVGRKELFEHLWIEDKWDWNAVYPVVRFDFGAGIVKTKEELDSKIRFFLELAATEYGVELQEDIPSSQFHRLLIQLEQKYEQKVVVLVDEYDKPILDNFTNREVSEVMRQGLRDLYSVMKAQQESLRFVLLTGVSKFAKVSVFSGLNNLEDISLTVKYGNICGYTQDDLEKEFVDWLEAIDLELMKKWYNGYNFLGDPVYNPFDVLLFLKNRQFKNYWFETGTPDFLFQLMRDQNFSLPQLEALYSTNDLMNKFGTEDIVIEGFFFQTGYLTIKEVQEKLNGSLEFKLGFPNLEVQLSLSELFLLKGSPTRFHHHLQQQIVKGILEGKPELFEVPIKQFFSSIPHQWYLKNEMGNYEGYWSSLIYSMLAMTGATLQAEDTTNIGRVDLSLSYKHHSFVIEFKMSSNPEDPIEQIKANRYYEKFLQEGQRIWLVGMTFDKEQRNLIKYQYEELE